MKKYILKPDAGGLEALDVREMDSKQLKPNEVSVRMHAVSLNYRDLIIAQGGVKQELVPLSDGAGQVEEVGSEVADLKAGDRVAGLFFRSGKAVISMPSNFLPRGAGRRPTVCWPGACMVPPTVF